MTRFCTQLNRSVTIPHSRKSLKYQHIFEYRPVSFYAVDYCTVALCIKDGVKIDPCAGSGHILDYLFDVLMQIYTDYGYTTSEAVRSIIENNLYGLDINERAAQFAYFSVMKKAILAKAFRGELGTKNPEDESADILPTPATRSNPRKMNLF